MNPLRSSHRASTLAGLAAALGIALAVGCSDSEPEATGGAGPAGPGVGPGPTSGPGPGPSSGPGPGSGGSGAEGGNGTGGAGASGGAGGAGGSPDCFTNPMTHIEIINACTTPDVVHIDKEPVLPQLNMDGSLPPLP